MAQNGGTRGGTFHGEMDRCRGSHGWTTAYSCVPERDGKAQGEDSPKQAGSCWLFLDDLRAFGINVDQWTTAAQDEREWRRTAEQGAEHFMAKWIAAEEATAGLRHAIVCPNVTGRAKERIAQSKRARAVCFRTTSELSASTPTSGRLQPRTRGNGAERRNISWRNGSLQRKPRLDYGMQSCART